MSGRQMPAAEVDVTPELVRALLRDQHPDLADLKLRAFANGWDNEMLRLGDDLVVRVPRREIAAVLVQHEQRWLPTLAPALPLPVPAPIRCGRPTDFYPWAWSVCPWLPGEAASRTPLRDADGSAEILGRFLAALHVPAPGDAPPNRMRGGPLEMRDADVTGWIAEVDGVIDGAAALRVWSDAVALPPWPHAPVWVHGDMHPANVLVHDGRISAVIDFGDLTSGDPAVDLASAWMLLPAASRPVLQDAAGAVDDDTWGRARGWALFFGVVLLAHAAQDPTFAALGGPIAASALAG